MNYSKELFEYAFGILSQRRREAEQEAAQRRAELTRSIPRLAEIEQELGQTGIALVRAVAAGEASSDQIDALRRRNLALQDESAQLLETAGFAPDALQVHYFCPICQDQGFVGTQMCSCMEQLMRDEKLRRLNAVSALPLAGFDSFSLRYYSDQPDEQGVIPAKRMADILKICRDFSTSFPNCRSLLLCGKTGLGKTHLSLSIAAEVIDRGYSVIYGSVQDLFRQIENERFSREGDRYSTLQSLLDCDLLVLDDLGTELTGNLTNAVLYNLVNSRINRRQSTIINTNLSMNELLTTYSERIVSRIMGSYTVLRFVGKDIRLLRHLQEARS